MSEARRSRCLAAPGSRPPVERRDSEVVGPDDTTCMALKARPPHPANSSAHRPIQTRDGGHQPRRAYPMSDTLITATEVRRMDGYQGDARLYVLSSPVPYGWGECDQPTTTYVLVSGVSVLGRPETYIFPADADGKVINWGEMDGSFQGDIDHEAAIVGAGWEVAS